MNKKTTIIVVGIVIFLVGFSFLQSPGEVRGEMDVYMGPECGCCEVYADIMDGYYDVEKHVVENRELEEIKRDTGVPQELFSCHTTFIDDYVVEGHIPDDAIESLREGEYDIEGIGMAGMPQGSPGMPGRQTEPFMIYEIPTPGQSGELFMEM